MIMRLLNLRLTLTLCVRLTHYNIMDGWMDGWIYDLGWSLHFNEVLK